MVVCLAYGSVPMVFITCIRAYVPLKFIDAGENVYNMIGIVGSMILAGALIKRVILLSLYSFISLTPPYDVIVVCITVYALLSVTLLLLMKPEYVLYVLSFLFMLGNISTLYTLLPSLRQ